MAMMESQEWGGPRWATGRVQGVVRGGHFAFVSTVRPPPTRQGNEHPLTDGQVNGR